MAKSSKNQGARASRKRAPTKRRGGTVFAIIVLVALVFLAIYLFWRVMALQSRDTNPAPAATSTALSSVVPTMSASPIVTAEPTAEPTRAESTASPTPATNTDASSTNGLRSAHIRVVGDVMFHQTQLDFAKKSNGTYDFDDQFAYIKDSLSDADFTIANLETTVGKHKNVAYSGYPQFNTPEVVLQTLKESGIDFFTMANNHMLDRWFEGLVNDVDLVEEYGFDHVGAYRTKKERNTPVVYEVNGIKIGFVAYTHATNNMENHSNEAAVEYGVPYLYQADIAGDIKKLRDAGAEVVIALPHWGTENVNTPDETQRQYAKKLASAGADIILGSHSHMVQPMELVEGTDANGIDRQVFIIYSMGNFISSMTTKYTDCGIILDFTIQEQTDGTFRVEDIGYVPVYVWKQNGVFAVISSAKYLDKKPDGMNSSQYTQMVKTYHQMVDRLGTDGFTVLTE